MTLFVFYLIYLYLPLIMTMKITPYPIFTFMDSTLINSN